MNFTMNLSPNSILTMSIPMATGPNGAPLQPPIGYRIERFGVHSFHVTAGGNLQEALRPPTRPSLLVLQAETMSAIKLLIGEQQYNALWPLLIRLPLRDVILECLIKYSNFLFECLAIWEPFLIFTRQHYHGLNTTLVLAVDASLARGVLTSNASAIIELQRQLVTSVTFLRQHRFQLQRLLVDCPLRGRYQPHLFTVSTQIVDMVELASEAIQRVNSYEWHAALVLYQLEMLFYQVAIRNWQNV